MAAWGLIFSFGTLFLCLFEVKPLYRMINDSVHFFWTAELTENSLNFFQNLFVEGPTLTSCAHTRSCDSRSVHPTGRWGCPISILCRSLTSSFFFGVIDLPSVLVKYGSLRPPISPIGNSNQLSFNGRRERIARKVEGRFAPVSGFSCGLAVDRPCRWSSRD